MAGKNSIRAVAFTLMLSTTMVCTVSTPGRAMLAPADGGAAQEQAFDRAGDMKTVQTALESRIVRERLSALGLSEAEIDSRLNRLSDQQVHQLAKDIDTLSAGGSLGGVLVIVVLVLLIVFLFTRI